MLDHYLHTAHTAWALSYPDQHPIAPNAPQPGVTAQQPTDYTPAWAWFTAEYPVLLALIHRAAGTGFPAHAWQLPHMLVPFFTRQGHWNDFHTALATAQHHDDRRG